MKRLTILLCLFFAAGGLHAQTTPAMAGKSDAQTTPAMTGKSDAQTFCNPIDLPYMFQPDGYYRSAADPVIVLYKDAYWLFVSKNNGYYTSVDMVHWKFIKGSGYPTEIFAPTVAVINGKLYLTTGGTAGTFTTDDPASGHWTNVTTYDRNLADPATFQDDDGRVYLYDGCSNDQPLRVTELDRETLKQLTAPVRTISAQTNIHGWEVPGDDNRQLNARPWIEGSWINKINGKYYLQYAAPGTQFSTYGDGLYISSNPTGPFAYASYSPFSFKPTGFITGSGHSCTFTDKGGRYWHVATLSISQRHMFERRLGLFPTGVLSDGQLVTNTYLGDYPQYAAGRAKDPLRDNSAHWMLLSYHKPAVASSTLAIASSGPAIASSTPVGSANPPGTGSRGFDKENAFDENIRTWWSAATGNAGEWLQVDLRKKCRINAIQVNFADQGDTVKDAFIPDGYGYYIETSDNGKDWRVVIDHRKDARDAPHDYTQLAKPVTARFVKIVNGHTPAGGLFSLYDFRIFGSGPGSAPGRVTDISAVRGNPDGRQAAISWKPVSDADFYIVRYGLSADRLFGNYQVYDSTSLDVHSLNAGPPYYFTVDAVNENGVTKGTTTIMAY
jgi:xylan 1,4-beta-xylosidase